MLSMTAYRMTRASALSTLLLLGTAAHAAGQALAPATVVTPARSAVPQAPLLVEKIDFKRAEDGSGRLILRFSGEGATADLRNQNGSVVVDLSNARVPANLQNTLNVGDFATPVTRVEAGGGQLVLSTQGSVQPMAFQHGREYIVDITAKAATPAVGTMSSAVLSQAAARVASKQATAAGEPVYRGRPINFDFQDIPVRTVLQLLANEAGLNIVASDTVQGNITLRMQGVPWDKALDFILKSKGLDKRRDGNVVWVAPAAEIAKSEQDKEDARIALENRQDLQTEYFRINYHNAVEIQKILSEAKGVGTSGQGGQSAGAAQDGFLSPRGRIVADARTNTLMVTDLPRKIESMRQLINEIDRPVDQVVIEARIVIATESFARDLGAKFGIGGRVGNVRIGSTTDQNLATANSISDVNYKYATDLNNYYGSGSNGPEPLPGRPTYAHGFNFSKPVTEAASLALTLLNAGGNLLDIELSAMQTEGRGEVISNPRIFTTNQRESGIKQGREVPYVTTTSANGVVTQTVQYKEAVLELRVTPTITNDDRIFLVVKVSKDEVAKEIQLATAYIPIIAKRQVDTAVLVDNGQTVVVGGVYEFTDSQSVSKVPFLGDIPFLGALFRNKHRGSEKAELLIFLTPRIIRVKQSMH